MQNKLVYKKLLTILYILFCQMDKEVVQTTHISSDLFTNSYLISPLDEEEESQEFWWTRTKGLFSKSKNMVCCHNASYYQCTILDYKSVIQLHVRDENRFEKVFTYGPIQLQTDLTNIGLCLKDSDKKFHVKALFTRNEPMEATVIISGPPAKVQIEVQLPGSIEFTIKCPLIGQDDGYETFMKMDETETNRVDVNFLKSKKVMVQVLKKLKIYSYQGNYLKLFFQSQHQRDKFFYVFFHALGFRLDCRNPVTDAPLREPFSKELPVAFKEGEIVPQEYSDNGLHDICEMLSSPKNFDRETAQLDESPISNPLNPSISQSGEEESSLEQKSIIKPEKPFHPAPLPSPSKKYPTFTYESGKYSGLTKNKTTKKLDGKNPILQNKNHPYEQYHHSQENQEIPQFIKKIMINKAINKAYHENPIYTYKTKVPKDRPISRQAHFEKHQVNRNSSTSPYGNQKIQTRGQHSSKNKESGLKTIHQYFQHPISPTIKQHDHLPHNFQQFPHTHLPKPNSNYCPPPSYHKVLNNFKSY